MSVTLWDDDAGQVSARSEGVGPMMVTLLGMLTLVKLVQSRNAAARCW